MAIPKVLDARVIYEETCKAVFYYQEKITFLHLLIMILVRAKAWWIKNPTSPAWCGPHGVSPVMYSCTIIILHKQYYQQKTNHPGKATSGNWRGRPRHPSCKPWIYSFDLEFIEPLLEFGADRNKRICHNKLHRSQTDP